MACLIVVNRPLRGLGFICCSLRLNGNTLRCMSWFTLRILADMLSACWATEISHLCAFLLIWLSFLLKWPVHLAWWYDLCVLPWDGLCIVNGLCVLHGGMACAFAWWYGLCDLLHIIITFGLKLCDCSNIKLAIALRWKLCYRPDMITPLLHRILSILNVLCIEGFGFTEWPSCNEMRHRPLLANIIPHVMWLKGLFALI